MQETELYQHVLGLETQWRVSEVDLNVELGEIVFSVTHPEGTTFCCPQCEQKLSCYDHSAPRRWRHLDSCKSRQCLRLRFPEFNVLSMGSNRLLRQWPAKPRKKDPQQFMDPFKRSICRHAAFY